MADGRENCRVGRLSVEEEVASETSFAFGYLRESTEPTSPGKSSLTLHSATAREPEPDASAAITLPKAMPWPID
jgi:hypothetical protein